MSEMKKVATLESVVFNYPAGNNALDKITMDLFQGFVAGRVVEYNAYQARNLFQLTNIDTPLN
jgi:hypothetical protein